MKPTIAPMLLPLRWLAAPVTWIAVAVPVEVGTMTMTDGVVERSVMVVAVLTEETTVVVPFFGGRMEP